jgi:hypothetical protein
MLYFEKENINKRKETEKREEKKKRIIHELMGRGPNYPTSSLRVCGTPHEPTRSAYSSSPKINDDYCLIDCTLVLTTATNYYGGPILGGSSP